MILDFLEGDIRPYLRYSAALHLALAIAAAALLRRSASMEAQTYRIDFIGPSAGIANRDVEASTKGGAAPRPAAAAEKIPPQAHPDEFAKKRRHAPLPRPSILSSYPDRAPRRPEPAAEAAPAEPDRPAAPSTPAAASGTEPAGASVSAEMPNFPYPWYISQVRATLWREWSARMPRGGGEVLVQFAILRGGGITDLRVESSSGDKEIDSAAVAAAQAAGASPFPPLPRGFTEPFLKIHVRFTSQ